MYCVRARMNAARPLRIPLIFSLSFPCSRLFVQLMEQIKCAGRAGIISYILWEWAFWIGAGGVATFTYYTATGGWPDLSNPDDQGKVAASAFALVNVARFAVPLRIGLALGTVPWVDENIVKRYLEKSDAQE